MVVVVFRHGAAVAVAGDLLHLDGLSLAVVGGAGLRLHGQGVRRREQLGAGRRESRSRGEDLGGQAAFVVEGVGDQVPPSGPGDWS